MIKTEIQEKKSLSHVSRKCYLNREWTHMQGEDIIEYTYDKYRENLHLSMGEEDKFLKHTNVKSHLCTL